MSFVNYKRAGSGSGGGGATNLNGLNDVDLVTKAPDSKDALVWDDVTLRWISAPPEPRTEIYTFTRADAVNNTVTINHTMGVQYPVVAVTDDRNKLRFDLDIEYVDITTLTISVQQRPPGIWRVLLA